MSLNMNRNTNTNKNNFNNHNNNNNDFISPLNQRPNIKYDSSFQQCLMKDEDNNQLRLCAQCAQNEATKLSLKRDYNPSDFAKVTREEIQRFEQRLEAQFPLCQRCKQLANVKLQDIKHKLNVFKLIYLV